MDYNEGKILVDQPNSVTLRGTEIIIDQMKKNVCKIYLKGEFKCTGFFCKIPFKNNNELPVLITSNQIINDTVLKNEKKLSISMNNIFKIIELEERIKYTNKQFGITIIEMKENDRIKDYLEIDDNIIQKEN